MGGTNRRGSVVDHCRARVYCSGRGVIVQYNDDCSLARFRYSRIAASTPDRVCALSFNQQLDIGWVIPYLRWEVGGRYLPQRLEVGSQNRQTLAKAHDGQADLGPQTAVQLGDWFAELRRRSKH